MSLSGLSDVGGSSNIPTLWGSAAGKEYAAFPACWLQMYQQTLQILAAAKVPVPPFLGIPPAPNEASVGLGLNDRESRSNLVGRSPHYILNLEAKPSCEPSWFL